MSPPLRGLVAATALSGMLAPWAAVIGTAVHLAEHHHDSGDHDHAATAALHGHAHALGTPDHDHGVSLPGGAESGLRPPVVNITPAEWGGIAAVSVSAFSCAPAPAASPPRLASIVLRI